MRTLSLLLALLAGLMTDGHPGDRRAGVVVGTITDAATGTPLSGVQIHVDGLMASALSARDGGYTLRFAPHATGELTIQADLIGYRTSTRQMSLGADSLRIDLALELTRQQANEPGSRDELPFTTAEAMDAATSAVGPAVGTIVPSRAVEDVRFKTEGFPVNATIAQPLLAAPGNLYRRDIGLPGRYDPGFEREAYDRLYENDFLAVEPNPLSTFGIDVDRASYANVRHFIREGRLPPLDAVRIEEMINYFSYDLDAPTGPDPFAVHTEMAPAPWNPLHYLVRIGIQGRRIDTEDLTASNLVFLLDVSGSMRPSNKLPLLKSALRLLIDQIRPEDRVAIVVYAGAAGLVLEPTPAVTRVAFWTSWIAWMPEDRRRVGPA